MATLDSLARGYLLVDIAQGMWLTLKAFFKPKVTPVSYTHLLAHAT